MLACTTPCCVCVHSTTNPQQLCALSPPAALPSDNIRELKKQLGDFMTGFMKQQNMDTEEGEHRRGAEPCWPVGWQHERMGARVA